MPFFSRRMKRVVSAETAPASLQFPLVLKEKARDSNYGEWIRNHRWNLKTERWCRKQIETFQYRPTVGILMESYNPREEFLRESLASIFNQIYPFHELSIVDRGSENSNVRKTLEELLVDSRAKISFQKGEQRDVEAIAKIMKRASAEWILLMGAEDVLEPNALYNMVASLQNTVEIDFVFSDSDLLDEEGFRIAPQFKPIWAVGAHYPLGYYQHPVLLHDRLVKKLRGHENISLLMLEGTLLDEASNHSRYVLQAPGVLYHGRQHGKKNETPPEALDNVLINENLIVKDGKIEINTELRSRSEPKTPLRILWAIDSLDRDDGPAVWFHLVRYLSKESGHRFCIVSLKDGPMRENYEKHARVEIAADQSAMREVVSRLHSEEQFDVAFVSSVENLWFPEVVKQLGIPSLWQLYPGAASETVEILRKKFEYPATIIFLNSEIASRFHNLDARKISRILPTGVDLADIKIFKQRNSPFDWRTKFEISNSAIVFSVCGATMPRKGQKTFVQAAIETLKKNSEKELQFLIAGAKPGGYLNEIKALIDQSAFAHHFRLIPETNDVTQYYSVHLISDVNVSCSMEEVFALSILEAMCMKKPILATRVFSSNEIVEEDENGYLTQPGDVAELADRIDFLANTTEVRDFFGRRSLEIIYEKFQFRKIAARLEDLLRESIVYE